MNEKKYTSCLESIVETHKKEIIKIFDGQYLKCLDKVTFKIEKQEGETHNRGKVPAKVTFMLGEKEVFRIFLKPRDATLDYEVIKLFCSINKLDKDRPKLPEYKIINIEFNKELYSLWEFIDGKNLEGCFIPMKSSVVENCKKRKELAGKVLWMDSVLRGVSISDLHGENVIFREVKGEPEIVPIDLESVQEGSPTGLYGEKQPELLSLKTGEIKLIGDFNREVIPNCRFRFVPLPTHRFLNALSNYDLVMPLALEIIKMKKYNFKVKLSKLEDLILEDIINRDVPFLTEYKGVLYYGFPEGGQSIGEKNKKGEKV